MEGTRNAGRRRLPTGLIGTLASVLAVEALVAAWSTGLAGFPALGARFAAEQARVEAPSCAVIGLGDSSLKFGFHPAVFEAKGGLRAYNLAVAGMPPTMGEALLSRALAAGARPKALVLGYVSLSGDPRGVAPVLAEVLGPAEALDLARDSRDPGLFAVIASARLVPSLRYRYVLRSLVSSRILGLAGRKPGSNPGRGAARWTYRTWASNRGADARRADRRPETPGDAGALSSPWLVHPAFERSLGRLVARAEAHGTRVFWLVPPIDPGAQGRREALGLDQLHTRNLRAVMASLPGVVVLDARRAGYPSTAFCDPCHLNAAGAARLSVDVAAAIGRHLDRHVPGRLAARWSALPTYEGDPALLATGAGGTTRLR